MPTNGIGPALNSTEAITNFREIATALDEADVLASSRHSFHIPDSTIYLDGNSLGLMPTGVPGRIRSVMTEEWAEGLISSWSKAGWFDLPITAASRLARLVGVGDDEIAIGDSTSINLFKCLAAGLHARPGRRVIVTEGDNFPTDNYMAQGLAELVPDVELRYFEPDQDPASAVDESVAVVLLSHVDYRSARVRDMVQVTADIHAKGALVLWDLSHTTGAVHCNLAAAGADMAVGCTYKYLNGGPGAPAFAWINPAIIGEVSQPLSGWMGHADPFDFTRSYVPSDGPRRLVCGTPQVISLSALDEALKVWDEVDLDQLWKKSRTMTSLFIEAVEASCSDHGLVLASPRDEAARGSHVSFNYENGFEVMQALAARGVVGDFRAPSTMRFGFAPLYLSFGEVVEAVNHLNEILCNDEWTEPRFAERGVIT